MHIGCIQVLYAATDHGYHHECFLLAFLDDVLAAYGLDERAITRVNNSEKEEDEVESKTPLINQRSCAVENGQELEVTQDSLWQTESFGMEQQTTLESAR